MKICIVCGKPYTGRNKYTCSRACWAKYRQHTRKCVVCGAKFYVPPSADTVTCSQECSRINRQRLAAEGKCDNGLERAHEARANDPRFQPNEQNISAKDWIVQAPDGTIYKCRNLMNFLREHSDMLDGTVQQAWDGIAKIKYSMQGKRKNPVHQWKGWRLLEWGN